MAVLRWMDQRYYSYSDRSLLFRHWWMGDQVSGGICQGSRTRSGSGRLFFHVYFQWCLYRAVLYRIHSVYSGHHLRRCPQRYRACIPHYDADPGSALCGHHSLFRYQTGSPERCEVFPDPESCEFLLDDSRSCHGTDVLLSVHCHGYSHYLRLLYEKRCLH